MLPFLPALTWGVAKGWFADHALKIAGIVAVLAMCAIIYFQYKHNVNLEASKQNLEATVAEKQIEIIKIQENAKLIADINSDLVNKERDLHANLYALQNKFTKNGRDFTALTREKPGLIEKIINDATAAQFDCVQHLTMGGPPCD